MPEQCWDPVVKPGGLDEEVLADTPATRTRTETTTGTMTNCRPARIIYSSVYCNMHTSTLFNERLQMWVALSESTGLQDAQLLCIYIRKVLY